MKSGNDQKPAADAEEAREQASAYPITDEPGGVLATELHFGVAYMSASSDHQDAHGDHDQRKKKQQLLTVEGLAKRRADQGSCDA